MDRNSRQRMLVNLVTEHGHLSVEDAASATGASLPTIRRDLDALADQQLLIRTRGGAAANPMTGDVPMRYRAGVRASEKNAIARAVAASVGPGDVIGLNGGTTTTAIGQEIAVRVSADPGFEVRELTVVTNAVNIANDLTIRPQIRVVLTGGVARTRSYELVGPLAQLALPSIRLDTLFLGVNAIEPDAVYTHSEEEASINHALVDAARHTIVVADASKLGASAFARICSMDQVSGLITDRVADPEFVGRLRDRGVEVTLV